MKRYIVILSTLLFAFSMFSAQAGYNRYGYGYGCAIKQQKLQQQLHYAEMYGNHYRVAGLQRALQEVRSRCGDGGTMMPREDRIAEKQRKVMKRERDLEKARLDGRPKKIDKKMRKLDEARHELQEAQAGIIY